VPPRRRRAPASSGHGRRVDAGPGGRILVDGRNVQHALARGSASPLPTVTLVARLRAAFSPPTEVELILDGHPGGSPSGRVAPGFSVSYSRHATADEVIGDRVAEALLALGPVGAWSVVVVSDDRQVRDHARRNGARVEGTTWLQAQLERHATGPGVPLGHGRPPRGGRRRPIPGA